MFNTKLPQGFTFILKLFLSITEMIRHLLTFENLCFKLTLEILDLSEKLSILSSEGFDLLALLIILLLIGKQHLQNSEFDICQVLQFLFKLLLVLSSHSLVVLFDLGDSSMLL
jgi:hypothetical protein